MFFELKVQFPNINVIPLVERKDVSFILTIFPKNGAFYYINHHISGTFSGFQIQQLAILKPVEVGKSYIPQKKALYCAV